MSLKQAFGVTGNIWRRYVRRFGEYEKVLPTETTPSRIVPDHINKPSYAQGEDILVPKQIEIKNDSQIEEMRNSCKLAASILAQLSEFIKIGITTDDIDEYVHNLTIAAGAYPSPLHYKGFPKSICTSVNNVAAHGIPDLRPLHDGDIVNVDITVFLNGYHGDCSKTFLVGNVDQKGIDLVKVTEECLDLAIKHCGPGVPIHEIGSTIYRHAKKHGLTVLPQLCGHGIGSYFHGPPDIIHTRNKEPGLMKPGLTFTIEPALTHGSEMTAILDDGWTLITDDSARSAQVEHTILITPNGAEILTI